MLSGLACATESHPNRPPTARPCRAHCLLERLDGARAWVEWPRSAGSECMTVVAASCSLAVRWRPPGSRCCSALERARERILRTPASLTGIVNGQSRRLGPLDALSPHHGGSKGVQRPFDAPPASCARLRPIHVTSTFRGEISHFTPPSALSAIPLTTSACPHPMAGQVLPQPPSEATWARARAVDAPVDFGSLPRVC